MLKGKAGGGGGTFEQPPAGMHAAVCTRVIDMGTQDGRFGPKRRLQLGFELDADREDGKPFMSFLNVNLSFHPKATLMKHLESWRGRKYADDEPVDLPACAGKGCLLNLVESDTGEYVNITAIMPLAKGQKAPTPAGDVLVLDLDEVDYDVLDKLSDRMRERIEATPEFRGTSGPDPAVDATTGDRRQVDLDDDIPF